MMFIVSQHSKKYTPEYRSEYANLVIESERPMGMFEALDSAAFPGMFDNGHRVERWA